MPDIEVRGWMTEAERQLLKRLAFGKRVLELGSYEGLSTISMAMTAKSVCAVDTFDGRATPEPKDTLQAFIQNVNQAGVLHKMRVLQGTTEERLAELAAEGAKFDLVFIDCDHSYEAVVRDIELSVPLLEDTGTIAFHDYDENHKGVVDAVNEFIEAGGHPIDQQNTLIALKLYKPTLEVRAPVVYLTMPHRDLQCHLGAAAGLYTASKNKLRQIVSNYGTSVLPLCFNTLYCEALNARQTEGVTHFAMLHNDVVPNQGWLDILMEEMQAGNYDMVSTVIPLKDARGLTSVGLSSDSQWHVRRLTMTEIHELPETFTAKDIPYRTEEQGLLLNTGCWLMRIDQPWAESLFFRQQDCIAWSLADNKFVPQSTSEDWDFSRQLIGRGCRIAATRKVQVVHERPEFSNAIPWGAWKTDEQFFETERVIAEHNKKLQEAA